MIAKVLQHPSLDIEGQLQIMDSIASELKIFVNYKKRPT